MIIAADTSKGCIVVSLHPILSSYNPKSLIIGSLPARMPGKSRFGELKSRFRLIRPKNVDNLNSREGSVFESCRGRNLATVSWKDYNATVACGFPEDIYWYKSGTTNNCTPSSSNTRKEPLQ